MNRRPNRESVLDLSIQRNDDALPPPSTPPPPPSGPRAHTHTHIRIARIIPNPPKPCNASGRRRPLRSRTLLPLELACTRLQAYCTGYVVTIATFASQNGIMRHTATATAAAAAACCPKLILHAPYHPMALAVSNNNQHWRN